MLRTNTATAKYIASNHELLRLVGALFPRSAIRAIVDRAECSTQVGLRNRLAARAPGCGAFFRTASRFARKKPRGFRQRGHWRTLCCSRTYAHVGVRRWQAMVNQR